jgi:hypothetical protein
MDRAPKERVRSLYLGANYVNPLRAFIQKTVFYQKFSLYYTHFPMRNKNAMGLGALMIGGI